MHRTNRWIWLLILGMLMTVPTAPLAAADGAAADETITAAQADAERQELADRIAQFKAQMAERETEIPPADAVYMGREVARTMHWRGAEWLTRPTRQREENTALLMKVLDPQPGMVICDLGAGNGYYTLKLSDALEDRGTVIAQDLQPEMLELLEERAQLHGAHDNLVYLTGTYINPMLPRESCDLVLLVDVYHEFSHPEHMLRRIREALKPGGRLVLVEFRGEDNTVPIRPEHKMTKDQIRLELNANGFEVADEFDELPWQHVMSFTRDEDWE
ncbi:MAG: class I SAM-dependent methyltransferase, partial [Phycisphaeraceae bacterium]